MKILRCLDVALVLTAELVLARPTPSAQDCSTRSLSFLDSRSHSTPAIKAYCVEATASHANSLRKRSHKNTLARPRSSKARQKHLEAHKPASSQLPVPPLAEKLSVYFPTSITEYSKASAIVVDIDPKEGTQLMDWEISSSEEQSTNKWKRSVDDKPTGSRLPEVSVVGAAAGVLAFVIILAMVDVLISARAKGWPMVRNHLRRISASTTPIVLDVNMPAESLLRIDAKGRYFSDLAPNW